MRSLIIRLLHIYCRIWQWKNLEIGSTFDELADKCRSVEWPVSDSLDIQCMFTSIWKRNIPRGKTIVLSYKLWVQFCGTALANTVVMSLVLLWGDLTWRRCYRHRSQCTFMTHCALMSLVLLWGDLTWRRCCRHRSHCTFMTHWALIIFDCSD